MTTNHGLVFREPNIVIYIAHDIIVQ